MTETLPLPIPQQIGPCRFGRLGSWITVQCPPEYDALMIQAGGVSEPRGPCWLLRLHHLAQVLCKLRRQTDQRSRRAGVDLDATS